MIPVAGSRADSFPARPGVRDLHVLEVRLALLVHVEMMDLHGSPRCVMDDGSGSEGSIDRRARRTGGGGGAGPPGLRHPLAGFAALRAAYRTRGAHFARPAPPPRRPPRGSPSSISPTG